jgi:hypothetical protein
LNFPSSTRFSSSFYKLILFKSSRKVMSLHGSWNGYYDSVRDDSHRVDVDVVGSASVGLADGGADALPPHRCLDMGPEDHQANEK